MRDIPGAPDTTERRPTSAAMDEADPIEGNRSIGARAGVSLHGGELDIGQLYRRLIEAVQDYAIFALDSTGHVVTWNTGAQRLKGYRADEIIGRHFSTFYPPEDVANGKPAWELEEATAKGRVEDEGWRVRKDGSRFWANVVITALHDDNGELIGFGKVTRDLTARRLAEEALRESEERFRLLVQSVKDYAIFMLDPNGNIATWNDGAQRLKGYRAEEIIGKHFSTFYIPEDIASKKPARELEIATRTGKYEEEGWRVRKDGTWFWANVVITAVRGKRGELLGFAKVTRDLTERRAAEQRALDDARHLAAEEAERHAFALREEELRRINNELQERAREERALRNLAQMITRAGKISDVMRQIAQGALAVSEAAGSYVEQVVSPNGDVQVVAVAGHASALLGQRASFPGSLTEEIIRRREPVFLTQMQGLGEAMAPYLDQHCHGCSVLIVPLFGEDSVLGALVLLRRPEERPFENGVVTRVRTLGDLASITLQRLVALEESERRRTEAEAAVRSRDEVLSVVSHDLRNPVSTVSMSASLLRDPDIKLSDEERRKQLEIIQRSAARMNRLIQDLLDVARIEGGRLTISCRTEAAAALATEACEGFKPMMAEKSQSLECEIGSGLPPLFVDRDRVLQILSNFLNNAMKFTPPSGRIALRVGADSEGGVRFSVVDSGPGIPAEELPHVFNRFWQSRRTAHLGSGLGLAIAKGLAEAHGGRVAAESRVGSGSTFVLWLPASNQSTDGTRETA